MNEELKKKLDEIIVLAEQDVKTAYLFLKLKAFLNSPHRNHKDALIQEIDRYQTTWVEELVERYR